MSATVIVVDSDPKQRGELTGIVESSGYPVVEAGSIEEVTLMVARDPPKLVIHDLDTVPVDSRFFRELKRGRSLHVIAVSGRTFHPELKEALMEHIFACLRRPLDESELTFWLQSIFGPSERGDRAGAAGPVADD